MEHLGSFVKRWSVDLPPKAEYDFADSLGGAWYITPTHHAIEFLTLAPLYTIFTLLYAKRVLRSPGAYELLTSTEQRPARSILEMLLFVMLIASFTVTVIHKAVTGTLLFLMQPCHASAILLILVMGWPNHKYPLIPRLLFNIYLHTLWGTILALIWPDLRDHDMLGEVFNFFMEHTLILVVPLYMTLTRRYPVLPVSIDMALFSFFLYAAYHSPVLHISSLLSGYNLNYALVPPALTFLIAAGPWYRFIMYTSALLLMFITRYGIVENFLILVQQIQIMMLRRKKSA
ncbi:hypothetical protein LRAMOSA05517 [Lichtheimia ramosa]|uniref:Uncharacterized protein n=1 Tax=Lichtheimia ramosa TaxID=688394 RepID=A0A077X1G2_9FUNG|nr:hypothetical protein LRAMOSA05517 [Lichtheimia ramosa]